MNKTYCICKPSRLLDYLKRIDTFLTGSVTDNLSSLQSDVDEIKTTVAGMTHTRSVSIVHVESDTEPNGIFVKVVSQIRLSDGAITDTDLFTMADAPYTGPMVPFGSTISDAFGDPIV